MARAYTEGLAKIVYELCKYLTKHGSTVIPALPPQAQAAVVAMQAACTLFMVFRKTDVE